MLVSCMRLVKEMHKNDVGNSHSNPIAGDHLHIPPVRSHVACSVMCAERPCAASAARRTLRMIKVGDTLLCNVMFSDVTLL